MALRAVIDHPKFARLKLLLRANRALTLGYLEAIWHFTGRFCPQGNIGKYPVEEVEAWVEWEGEPGGLIAAMVKARWIDDCPVNGLIVHDWYKHADDATKLALKRSKVGFMLPSWVSPDSVATESPQCPDSVATESGLPEPEPVPEPVIKQTQSACAQIFEPPEEAEVVEAMAAEGVPDPNREAVRFLAHYQAAGWRRGGNPVLAWLPLVGLWEPKPAEVGTDPPGKTGKPAEAGRYLDVAEPGGPPRWFRLGPNGEKTREPWVDPMPVQIQTDAEREAIRAETLAAMAARRASKGGAQPGEQGARSQKPP